MFIKDGDEKKKTIDQMNDMLINSILAKAQILKNL